MSPTVREQVISATNGSTVNMLSIDGLQRPEFKQPEKEKVSEFTTIIKGFWKKKHINSQQIIAISKLRNLLLPKLISGEIRIKQE
jgi:type I restriction enzyme S subunit